ncbi:MAG: DNA alkylation repair protein [Alphaproteobacteria bacterium]|nr:MAG: DNA alkylation repair protein [Alphaproteobacteria bacterium]
MSELTELKTILNDSVTIPESKRGMFFKTDPGAYSAHDEFIGVTNPNLRKIAKQFQKLSFLNLQKLIESPINEERLLALFILVHQYQKGDKDKVYEFYIRNLQHVNNWNLVDASAHLILGACILHRNKDVLLALAHSNNMWERRIAIVATWYFIRHQELEWTFKLAKILLNDSHDLIHKAVGWMLREAGAKNRDMLMEFLNEHASAMPRTMLRYAIEKFLPEERQFYLQQRRTVITSLA